MPKENESKEEISSSKKDSLSEKEMLSKGMHDFGNPIFEKARNSLNHHRVSKEHKNFRFFKSVPTDSFGEDMYLKMLRHQSLPYEERIIKELGLGIAAGFTKFPFSVALSHLEKGLYPRDTPLGIPPYLWNNRNFRLYAKFGAPIGEELFFRGALLYGLHAGFTKQLGMKDSHAAIASSVVNSLIFSAVHSKGMRLHTLMGGMICSGMTYYCDGSLVPAISSHMTNNNIAVAISPLRR